MIIGNNIKIINHEGNKLIGNSKDGEELFYNQALRYALENANLKLKSKNKDKIYREYMEAIAKIKYYKDYENSITWWKTDFLVKLQVLSRTNDNMIALELERRYIYLRNKVLELIDLNRLKDIIDHLPLYIENDFSVFVDKSKKENTDISQKVYNIIKEMLLISDSTNLNLDIFYKLDNVEKVK